MIPKCYHSFIQISEFKDAVILLSFIPMSDLTAASSEVLWVLQGLLCSITEGLWLCPMVPWLVVEEGKSPAFHDKAWSRVGTFDVAEKVSTLQDIVRTDYWVSNMIMLLSWHMLFPFNLCGQNYIYTFLLWNQCSVLEWTLPIIRLLRVFIYFECACVCMNMP